MSEVQVYTCFSAGQTGSTEGVSMCWHVRCAAVLCRATYHTKVGVWQDYALVLQMYTNKTNERRTAVGAVQHVAATYAAARR